MPRYGSYGGFDSAPADDGDVGFRGVNLRLPTWQLGEGILALSENGRIDGDWIPRRGCDVVTEGSLATGSPLRLPFWLIDDAGLVVDSAERTGANVVLTILNHGLPDANTPASVIVDPSGADNSVLFTGVTVEGSNGISIEYLAVNPSGYEFDAIVSVTGQAIQISPAYHGSLSVSGTLTSNGVTPVVFPQLSYTGFSGGYPRYSDGFGTPSYECSRFGSTWTLTKNSTASWYSNEDVASPFLVTTWFPLAPATGFPVISAGITTALGVVNAVNNDSVASLLVNASPQGSATGQIAPIGPAYLQGGSQGGAYLGLELVDAPFTVDPNGVWFMTPTDPNTLEFTIPGATGNEVYDVTFAMALSRLDDSASASVLGSCLFSDPSSENAESIFLAFGSSVKRVNLSDGSVDTYGLPGSDTIDTDVDMIQAMDKVQIYRAEKVAFEWHVGDTDFAAVPSGTYTQPQVFTVTGGVVDVVSGVCTISGLANTTVSVGDSILIYATTNANFTDFVGKTYYVFAANGTSFSFYIPVQDLATIGTDTLSLGRQVSLGGGFIHQPAFPWAIYFQRRIWGPYSYDWSGGGFVDRGIRDELVASDILDSDTYDPISNQFRITPGTADYIVALHPYSDDKLLVLNRNSLHQIQGTRGSLEDTTVNELTREIGCLARRSVVTQGNAIFFLSDNGVYVLEFFNDYNLRGMEKPLSEAIQPYIDRISTTLAMDAVGTYYDNRYWLAVPLDSTPGQGDAVGNNAILVFNMLNREWESIDTFGDTSFIIENFIIGTAGIRNDLYAITATGGIHVLNRLDEDYDNIATNLVTGSAQFPINARLSTRAYMCGTMERKRFTEIGMQMRSGSAQSDVALAFVSEDPDDSGTEDLASSTMGGPLATENTADVRLRIGGVRGFNGQIKLRRVIGRPSIRSMRVEASITNRATVTQK